MKLNLQQLEQHISQKKLASIYIISGDELLLVQEAADAIRTAAIQAGFTERVRMTVDPGNDWSQLLYTNTHSMSLFSTKQIIEIDLHHAKFSANTTKALQEYAAQPQQDIVVIIRTNKVDGKTEKSAWFQALEKKSVYLPIWPISATQLPSWIAQRAKKIGVRLSSEHTALLASQSEGNLLAAAQEIEKLSLMGDSPTSGFFTDYAQFTVFDLVDSMLAGNHGRSLRILNSLAEEDVEPTLILWALTREFRTMATLFRQLKQGATLSSLFSQFNIYEKRQAPVRSFIQRHSMEKCWESLLEAAQIDRMIKGAEQGNVWDRLQRLCLFL